MNRNFAMMVLPTVSHARAETCPPPCVNTTNKLQPFGHRRGIKTSTRPIRFAQLVEPVLPLLGARGSPDSAELTGCPGYEDRAVIGHATSLPFAELVIIQQERVEN